MKYNVVKVLNYPSGSNTIEILSNVEFQQAIQELESQNEHQKCEMFQDVSNVNYTLDLPSFVCVKNGMTIIYQVELNHFETMADMFRPSVLSKRKVHFPTHQLN
jgi:hypothetical protein